MVTKNKFFTFPARLTPPPPGSRSITAILYRVIKYSVFKRRAVGMGTTTVGEDISVKFKHCGKNTLAKDLEILFSSHKRRICLLMN